MSNIILKPEMGPEVLRHLSQFGALPEKGVVAGQAVASAIDDLYGKGGGVYNDVDVFRLVGANIRLRSGMATTTTALTSAGAAPVSEHYSVLEEFLRSMRSYRVSSVSEKGMLNLVNCAMPMHVCKQLTAGRVIQSFDLNCVRVAVDLESKQLVWDRHFERFLQTRQLEIAAVHTPWHTFLRMLRKLEQLPDVFADIPASAEAAAAVAQSLYYQRFLKLGNITRTFGKKARDTAERYRSIWEPYFSLEEVPLLTKEGKDVVLYSMEARGKVDSALMSRVNRLYGAALHYSAQAVYEGRRQKSKRSIAVLADLKASLEGASPRNPLRVFVNIHQERYVEGHVSPAHASTVRNFLDEHHTMEDAFADMTLDQQFNKIKQLKKLEKEFGNWIYGVLETSATPVDMANEAVLVDMLQRYDADQKKPIEVEPLRLPPLPAIWTRAGIKVEELLTRKDLHSEGNELRHCVGGYADRIRSNDCRILRIRTSRKKEGWSTVEVTGDGYRVQLGKPLQVVQHRTYRNGAPGALNEAVLKYVVAMYGAPKWKQILHELGLLTHAVKLQMHAISALRTVGTWIEKKGAKLSASAKAQLKDLERFEDIGTPRLVGDDELDDPMFEGIA